MAALPTYQKVQESTVYTMQYIMTAKLAKLYTFSVSDQVLWELQQCIREYMKYYINHSFKSLKILDTIRTKFKPLPIFNVYKVFHNANPICIQMAGGKNDGENLEHFLGNRTD